MSHFWVADADQLWNIAPLEQELYSIGVGDHGAADIRLGSMPGFALVAGHRTDQGKTTWVLMTTPQQRIWVNGARLPAGLRVLQDRDHIRMLDKGVAASFFYSSEVVPRVEPFPGAAEPVTCPRSRTIIEPGTPAVKCPGCGAWYHQSPDYPSWTYSEKCTLCKHPTDLEAGFQFTPEEL